MDLQIKEFNKIKRDYDPLTFGNAIDDRNSGGPFKNLPTVIGHIKILQQVSIGNKIIDEKTLFPALIQNISSKRRP